MRPRTPVALALDGRGSPTVVCNDGTVWFWGADPEKVGRLDPSQRLQFDMGRLPVAHKWIQFHSPIPDSAEDIAMRAGGAE